MTDLITVTGVVGSDPRAITTSQQLPITSFRLASARRYFNRTTGGWEDAGTNWYTVSAFRNLAFNANASLRKGEHVIVHGRLKQRDWQAGEKSGTAIEIEADAIGHDLTWGMTQLQRLERTPLAGGASDPVGEARGALTAAVDGSGPVGDLASAGLPGHELLDDDDYDDDLDTSDEDRDDIDLLTGELGEDETSTA